MMPLVLEEAADGTVTLDGPRRLVRVEEEIVPGLGRLRVYVEELPVYRVRAEDAGRLLDHLWRSTR